MKKLVDYIAEKKVLILGFGLEGKSTYETIRNILPGKALSVADAKKSLPGEFNNFQADKNLKLYYGSNYLDNANEYDLIIKSPGISYKVLDGVAGLKKVSSQSEIFISLFKNNIIGITGTKGKSTTSSLLLQILRNAGIDALLAGNIGVPPFSYIQEIKKDTKIVYELSSHQLERINVSPHISIMLNIYMEHLDHYNNYFEYKAAKFNIARNQSEKDFLIVNFQNDAIFSMPNKYFGKATKVHLNEEAEKSSYCACKDGNLHISIKGEKTALTGLCNQHNLPGKHNLLNIQAAAAAAYIAGASPEAISSGVSEFQGLPHRLEHVGTYNGAVFINDSISTIPEATIAALEAFPGTKTLILGGFDRGVLYNELIDYIIMKSNVNNLVFIGEAGTRMYNSFMKKPGTEKFNCFLPGDFSDAIEKAKEVTLKNEICLLSPAAASYDSFKNFEERGKTFIKIVNKQQLA